MTTKARDELAALILSEIGKADHPSREPYVSSMGDDGEVTIDGHVKLLNLCDAILARWRLVPKRFGELDQRYIIQDTDDHEIIPGVHVRYVPPA